MHAMLIKKIIPTINRRVRPHPMLLLENANKTLVTQKSTRSGITNRPTK